MVTYYEHNLSQDNGMVAYGILALLVWTIPERVRSRNTVLTFNKNIYLRIVNNLKAVIIKATFCGNPIQHFVSGAGPNNCYLTALLEYHLD